MAHVKDKKRNLYSQKQSIRDELSAPQHLPSAGDELIKNLAKKQSNTSTSLQEQLLIVQNFEKKSELKPYNLKGVTTLDDFKKNLQHEPEPSCSNQHEIQNVDDLMKITGLTRHELELSLSEKPTSTTSRLYRFAIANKQTGSSIGGNQLEKMLPNHPINHLKELERECLIRSNKPTIKSGKVEKAKKKKKRKRKKTGNPPQPKATQREDVKVCNEGVQTTTSISRPSLWDVKDMEKWKKSKEIGCKNIHD